jgi:hypothetical protein
MPLYNMNPHEYDKGLAVGVYVDKAVSQDDLSRLQCVYEDERDLDFAMKQNYSPAIVKVTRLFHRLVEDDPVMNGGFRKQLGSETCLFIVSHINNHKVDIGVKSLDTSSHELINFSSLLNPEDKLHGDFTSGLDSWRNFSNILNESSDSARSCMLHQSVTQIINEDVCNSQRCQELAELVNSL